MNTKQPDNEKECTNCGRPVYGGLHRCDKCHRVYLDGYDEGFQDGIKAGQSAFEATLTMIFGKSEAK